VHLGGFIYKGISFIENLRIKLPFDEVIGLEI
jgi:hypothetical protein